MRQAAQFCDGGRRARGTRHALAHELTNNGAGLIREKRPQKIPSPVILVCHPDPRENDLIRGHMSGGQSTPPKDVWSQPFSAHATQALEIKHVLGRTAPPLPDVLVGYTEFACDCGDSACRAQRFC